jgi:hypothetical protein
MVRRQKIVWRTRSRAGGGHGRGKWSKVRRKTS